MRKLAVFDIDGTLTNTNAVDDECFLQSIGELIGVSPQLLDWSDAPHVTDAALLTWLADRHHWTLALDHRERVLRRFVELLQQQCGANPHRFEAIPGAPGIRTALSERGWEVALATGAWEPSARIKLGAIGFDTADLVLATSSDALTRQEIVELAIHLASARSGSFDRIVSIGDAAWDVRTAAQLRLPFIGVATGARAERLRAHGATTIIADLADTDAVCAALEEAAIPTVL